MALNYISFMLSGLFGYFNPAGLEQFRGGRAQILPLLRCGNWRVFEFQPRIKVSILSISLILNTPKMFGDVYCDAESGKFDMNCGISPLFLFKIEGKTSPPLFWLQIPH